MLRDVGMCGIKVDKLENLNNIHLWMIFLGLDNT